jgi:hypothetical protein
MANPLVTKDLAEQILELREDVERQLKANKYYIALHKLDELLAAIKPLESVEAAAIPVEPRGKRLSLLLPLLPRPSRPGHGPGSSRRRWSRARQPGCKASWIQGAIQI